MRKRASPSWSDPRLKIPDGGQRWPLFLCVATEAQRHGEKRKDEPGMMNDELKRDRLSSFILHPSALLRASAAELI